MKQKSASGLFAGVCFLVSALLRLAPFLFIMPEAPRPDFLSLALLVVLGLLTLLNLRSFVTAIPAALIGLYDLVLLARDLIEGVVSFVYFAQLAADILGWLALALVLAASDPKAGQLKSLVRSIFFLPAIFIGLYSVLTSLFTIPLFESIRSLILYIFFPSILTTVGAFLAGKWAAEDAESIPGGSPNQARPAVYAQIPNYNPNPGYAPNPNVSPVRPNPVPPGPTEEVMNQLRNYKKLLDEGILTQEEFDAKKKQLLG